MVDSLGEVTNDASNNLIHNNISFLVDVNLKDQLESIFKELFNKNTIALTIKSYLRRIVENFDSYVDKSLPQIMFLILEL